MNLISRKLATLLVIGLAFGTSACSADPSPKAEAAPISVNPSTDASESTEASPTPSVSDQEVAEKEGFYRDNLKWKSGSDIPDPKGDAGSIASNMNWFLQKVTYEWINSPANAYPDGTPTRKVFPLSSVYVSQSIPEYQSQKLFSAITNTVDKWHDVQFMTGYESINFTEDGTHASVLVSAIGATASPNMGMLNALNDYHASPGSGYIIFAKEGRDWKISGIGAYYGKEGCFWNCLR